jgi:hypothetical protein
VSDDGTPLRDLDRAVQAFATAEAGEDVLVTQALVIYEITGFDDDLPWRRVAYTIPTDNFSVSGAIGLADAGRLLTRRDGLGLSDDD